MNAWSPTDGIKSPNTIKLFSLLGETASIVVGLSMFAAAAFALAFVNEGWQVYLALVFGQCGTIAVPVMLGQLSRAAPEMQGEAMGGIQSVTALAVVVAPLIGALAFGDFGTPETAFGGEWVFILSGLIDLLALGQFAARTSRDHGARFVGMREQGLLSLLPLPRGYSQ